MKKIFKTLILMALIFMIMPITTYAREITKEEGTGSLNMKISKEGILSWDAVDGATSYSFASWHNLYRDYYKDNLTSTSYNVLEMFDSRKIESGIYELVISANGAYGNDSMYFHYISPYDRLDSPKNPRWDDNYARWNAVTNATRYEIRLYNAVGEEISGALYTENTQIDLSIYSPQNGWYFTVNADSTATAPSIVYRKSMANESARKGGTTQVITPIETDGKDGKMHFYLSAEGVLSWDAVAGATGYEVRGYYNNELSLGDESIQITTSYNLISFLNSRRKNSGTWRIEVLPQGVIGKADTFEFYYTSPYDRLDNPTNLRWDGKVAKWDTVTNATGYEVTIYNEKSNPITTINTTNNLFNFSTLSPQNGWYFKVGATATSNYRDSFKVDSPIMGGRYHKVTFYSNGGSSVLSQIIMLGDRAIRPDNPTKEGNIFVDWYADLGCTELFDFMQIINTDITIIAKWNIAIPSASVTITPAAYGEHPDFSPVSGDSSKYTVELDQWYLHLEPYPQLYAEDTFGGGATYSVRITFTAKEGYQFADDAVFLINGEDVHGNTTGKKGYTEKSYYIESHETYTLTFNANGGTGTMAPISNLTGEYTLPECTFTPPAGKIFKGWSIDDDREGASTSTTAYMNSDHTAYAMWDDTYTLTFIADNGTDQTDEVDGLVMWSYHTLGTPESHGFTIPNGKLFNGWYNADNNTTLPADYNYLVLENKTFVARWIDDESLKDYWDVTFELNGGTMIGDTTTTVSKEENEGVARPTNDPTRSGYTFVGWFDDETLTVPYIFGTNINDNKTIYAKWTKNIVINSVSATITAPTVGSHPDFNPVPGNSEAYSIEFKQWYLVSSELDYPQLTNSDTFEYSKVYIIEMDFIANPGYEFSNDAVFTLNGKTMGRYGVINSKAQYEFIMPERPTFTITFNENGGSGYAMSSISNLYGNYILPECTYTPPEGKQFKGWSLTSNGPIITEVEMNQDREVFAIWEDKPLEPHKITFNANGGTGTMDDVNNLTGTYTLPANTFTAPEGKVFRGWSLTSDGPIITQIDMSEDREVYAIWKDITDTIPGDFNDDGEVGLTDIIYLLKRYLGIESTTASDIQIGDFNNDGEIGLQDIIAILKAYLGIA